MRTHSSNNSVLIEPLNNSYEEKLPIECIYLEINAYFEQSHLDDYICTNLGKNAPCHLPASLVRPFNFKF